MNITAMKQALDALKGNCTNPVADPEQAAAEDNAITALRQAIEQAEKQEPDLPPVFIGVDVTLKGTQVNAFYRRPNDVAEMFYSEFHPLAKPEQEPVAWRNAAIRLGEDLYSVGPNGYYEMTAKQWLDWALSVVNTAPPRKPWVGLTNKEVNEIWQNNETDWESIKRVEAKLKELNT
jgi:hypothetical protein